MLEALAPVVKRPFQVVELVLQLFFVVPQFGGFVESLVNISPPNGGRASVRPMANLLLLHH